jgi:hypothetical protein
VETVRLEGSDDDIRVVFDSREERQLFVRYADPVDGEEPPRVLMYDDEELVVMTPIAAVGHHTSPVVGRIDDFLFSSRVVFVRREPGRVFARTARRGEPDNGRRVHLRPGEELVFEEGSVVAELDALDDMERAATTEGFVALTPVLWSWLALRGQDTARNRYLLAAARRLDAAALRLDDLGELRAQMVDPDIGGPAIRRALFELIGAVEVSVVAIGRVVDMASRAADLIGVSVPMPTLVASKQTAVNEIRNAYEHIEDRALGQVWKKPDPDALTIFNHVRLVEDNVIEYGSHTLDLTSEVPALLEELRKFLMDAARND